MYDTWDDLEKACKSCKKCALSQTRNHVVFGVGSRQSPILFVGEGPGEQEDLRGEPFIGRGGQLLDKLLTAIDLSRKEVYIANIIKCRPPKNRDPLPEEQEICIDYLREQTRLLRPRLLVCLGRIAAQRIIAPDFKVTQQHGQWIERGGIRIMGTFHPAALLRNPHRKPAAFEDFLSIRRLLDEQD